MKWAQRALLASLVSESKDSAISPQDLPQDWAGPGSSMTLVMQAQVRLQVIEEMLASSPPGVAGLVLHSLTRWVSQSWPQDGEKPICFIISIF